MDSGTIVEILPGPVPAADLDALRRLVDVVWQHATESTAVPFTKTADMLIERWRPQPPGAAA
jgi:hypothetical protein